MWRKQGSYRLEVTDKENYVYIKFLGSWREKNGIKIIYDTYSAISRSGNKKALIDFRESGHIESSTEMDFNEASYASTLPDIGSYKIVAVFRKEDISRLSFWETVAVNRGIDMTFFQSEGDALKWLLGV